MKWLTILCVVFVSTGLFSQQLPFVDYAAVTSFNWSLFKGKVNIQHLNEMGDNTQAVTVSSLSYTADAITDRSATLKVVAQFNPNESWTRYPNMERQEIALDHEKRHFDITEIYARKIRKAIATGHFTSKHFSDALNTLFKDFTSQHRAEQNKYDFETMHSMDAVQQKKWNKWIDEQLEALSDYSKTALVVVFK
ncbi:MAG: hypothetical protein KA166_03490 [Saprospiraceae bacterium]|nr:hypothetical protein [Saprospiraceae bacterium]